MQTLSSCAGVLRCRNARNSDAAISRSRRLHHRQGHARKYLPTAQPEGAARGSIFPQRARGRPRHHAEADPCRCRRAVSYTHLTLPTNREGRAASSPGGASSGGAWPRMGITDPRGDIAGDPAVGYGRFRFHPNIIPRIIISASANSVRTAPQGAARKTSGPAG